MVLLESENIPMGMKAPNFSLPGVDGNMHSLADFVGKKALIVMFICNHCPYVHAVIDRIVAIQNDYADKDVALVAISANDATNYPDDSFENMKVVAEEWGVKTYLYDEDQSVAKAYKAKCTPDMFIFDENQELVYHGRIDDNWKDESSVIKQDMREALDAIVAGEKPSEEQVPSMGCSIKWKE